MTQYRPVADHAVLVEFSSQISEAAHEAVLALDQALAANPFPGFREAIPAFVNLLVDFDPVVTDHAAVTAHLGALEGASLAVAVPTRHEVAVRYDGQDIEEVARRTGLSAEAVIAAHLSGDFKVFMYGFAPGYAYLGGLPELLRLDRKHAPLRDIPAGSVIIAGAQCLITTLTMPTGWWIIGHTETRVLTGQADRPFLFDVGDRVTFKQVQP